MRKLMLPLYGIFLTASVYAQADTAFASVKYKLTHITDTTWPENPAVTNYILYLGKNLTMYTNYDRELGMKTTPASGTITGGSFVGNANNIAVVNVPAGGAPAMPNSQMAVIASMGNIYKKPNEGKLGVLEYTYGQMFAVEDQMPEINWSIQTDIKEIMGLQVQKAVADFRGRTYEAWFSSALPYSNGPWKLNGLPGLIIEAYDTKKEVIFSFVGFENLEEKKAIGVPSVASKASPKEFKQYKEALEKDNKAMAGNSVIAGGTMTVRGTISGTTSDGKPQRFRGMNNPIEKETKDTKK